MLLSSVLLISGGGGVVGRRGQDVVEAPVALLGLAAVALDPRRHQVEDLRLQVHRPALGLPPMLVHTGGHDSSMAFHRYQAAGLRGFAAVSTGTWLVALADAALPDQIDEQRGMTINADMGGKPVLGALTMGGREYAAIAGDQPPGARVDPARLAHLIAQGTFALPTFGTNDGQFPGSAGQGRIIGPPPADAGDRLALAVLTAALLTQTCGNLVAPRAQHVDREQEAFRGRDPASGGREQP